MEFALVVSSYEKHLGKVSYRSQRLSEAWNFLAYKVKGGIESIWFSLSEVRKYEVLPKGMNVFLLFHLKRKSKCRSSLQ
jgi:hypothetical protein